MKYNDRNLNMLITVKIESRIEKVIKLSAQHLNSNSYFFCKMCA